MLRQTSNPVPTRIASFLTVASFLTFVAALNLPAVRLDNGSIADGYTCLLFGFIYWPSNFLFLLAPLMVFASIRGGGCFRTVAGFIYLLSAFFVSYIFLMNRDHSFYAGSYAWLAAHWGAAIAMVFASAS